MLVSYARVSSVGQSLDIQEEALRAAGVEKLFSEKVSGITTDGRDALADALDFVRDGDVLIVTRLDRLARSVSDLFKIVERLTEKKVSFRCLQQSGVDTDTSTGRLTLTILGAVAAFENDIRRERQRDGIEKAKERGIYKGRRPTIDAAQVREMYASGVGGTEIASQLGIARGSVYRLLRAA